jgi:hypothetical protein
MAQHLARLPAPRQSPQCRTREPACGHNTVGSLAAVRGATVWFRDRRFCVAVSASESKERPMAQELPWWLQFIPHHPGDPGPEIYRILSELPVERQFGVVQAINVARGELDAARAKGYAQIGVAVAAAARGGGKG